MSTIRVLAGLGALADDEIRTRTLGDENRLFSGCRATYDGQTGLAIQEGTNAFAHDRMIVDAVPAALVWAVINESFHHVLLSMVGLRPSSG